MELRESQKALLLRLESAERMTDPQSSACIGRLSAHMSFGKTFLMLALIQRHRVPVARRGIPLGVDGLFYWVPTRYLPSTLVVATTMVIKQWVAHIHTYAPALNFLTIESLHDLQQYEDYIYDGQANVYDIVFVKAGNVKTTTPRWAPESYTAKLPKSQPILNALNAVVRGLVWARVVIDDYDTIPLTGGAMAPPAYFTWLVSATDRSRHRKETYGYVTLTDILTEAMPECTPAYNLSQRVPAAMVLSNVAEFSVPRAMETTYTLTPPPLSRILGKGVVSAEVREAIHSSSYELAASLLGVQCNTPGEMVAAVFSTNKRELMFADSTLALLDAVDWENLRGRPASKTKSNLLMKRIRVGVKENQPGLLDSVRHDIADWGYSPHLEAALFELRDRMASQRAKATTTLSTLRENLFIGWCQVCKVPWGCGDPQYIMLCCSLAVCEACVLDSASAHGFVSRCPSCAADVTLGKSFIRTNEVVQPADLQPAVIRMLADTAPSPASSKTAAMVSYIQGCEVSCLQCERRPHGDDDSAGPTTGEVVDRPEGSDRRYLVYTFHPQSRSLIETAFRDAGLAHGVLLGSSKQRAAALREFTTGPSPQILLVSAAKDCAGLHLFETTHLLLYHQFANQEARAQVIGRAQRNGRQHSLEIVSFLYPDECDSS